MGRIRSQDFEAVIGVGGKSSWFRDADLAYKINWIGINPSKTEAAGLRGPHVRFKHLVRYDEGPCDGPELRTIAPKLFRYMFEENNVRHVMSQSLDDEDIQKEIIKILGLAEKNQRKARLIAGAERVPCADENESELTCINRC